MVERSSNTIPKKLLIWLITSSLIISCSNGGAAAVAGTAVMKTDFGTLETGEKTQLYTITNANGVSIGVSDFGASFVSYKTFDSKNNLRETLLGFDDAQAYSDNPYNLGATIGRFANRIAKGQFQIDGNTYQLDLNDNGNNLHSGNIINKQVWSSKIVRNEEATGIELEYLSPDNQGGMPGNIKIRVTYWLEENNNVKIDLDAVTDKATIVNLTNHAYFNLNSSGDGTSQLLKLNANAYTPTDLTLIPTGEIVLVKGSAFDLTKFTSIRNILASSDPMLVFLKGMDNNFVVNQSDAAVLNLAATIYSSQTERGISLYTTQPGIQVFTAQGLDAVGRNQQQYNSYHGVALECQNYPDAPNHSNFPNSVLRPNQEYHQEILLVPFVGTQQFADEMPLWL